jgi:large subunit ribosomal protein L10
MLRGKKAQIIAQLADKLSRSAIVVATSYQGLVAKEMAELRRALAGAGVDYRVVKNTLVGLAARSANREQVMNIVDGPTALAFGYDDAIEAVKALNQYIKSRESSVEIRGGLLEERVLSGREVIALADLPPKLALISQLVAQLEAPIRGLHNVLNAPLRGLGNVLQAIVLSKAKDVTE